MIDVFVGLELALGSCLVGDVERLDPPNTEFLVRPEAVNGKPRAVGPGSVADLAIIDNCAAVGWVGLGGGILDCLCDWVGGCPCCI
jgi:hypothetical protein